MTYKQIETLREIRLWLGQVIVPGSLLALTIKNNPDLMAKFDNYKEKIKMKLRDKGVIK